MSEFEQLLDTSLEQKDVNKGEIVEGKVVKLDEDAFYVDIGSKSEGVLPYSEVVPEDIDHLEVGDPVRVKVIRADNGKLILSKRRVDYDDALDEARRDSKEENLVEITLDKKVNNGFEVSAYGGLLRGFIHDKSFPFDEPEVGDSRHAHLVEVERDKQGSKKYPHRLFFSRRELVKDEREQRIQEEFESLQEGMIVNGKVENITDYGAFISVTDHLTGLLHVSEMGWDRVDHPNDVVDKGEEVRVKIIELEDDRRRISLSLKALQSDPLLEIIEGETYEGKVESIADFGLFVKLPNGVTGLVHNNELAYRHFHHPEQINQVGDEIEVQVLNVNISDRRVSLSKKALMDNPWEKLSEQHSVGDDIEVKAKKLVDTGVIVEVSEHIDGFIPIGEICPEHIEHPKDRVSEGDEFKARIYELDPKNQQLKLSIRSLHEEKRRPARNDREIDVPISQDESEPTAQSTKLGDIFEGELEKVQTGGEEEPESTDESDTGTETDSEAEEVQADAESDGAGDLEASEDTEDTQETEASAESDEAEELVASDGDGSTELEEGEVETDEEESEAETVEASAGDAEEKEE